MKASTRLQLGILPVAGGWCDQAATFCDASELVGNQQARYLEQQLERSRKGKV